MKSRTTFFTDRPALIYAFFCNRRTFDKESAFFAKIVRAYNNVEAYLTGNISALDVAYLAGLSDEALPSLARLPADMSVYEYEEGNTVGRLLEERRVHAARMAGSWRTWNLASWRAARSG